MDETYILLVATIVFFALFVTGMPLAFVMAFVGVVGISYVASMETATSILTNDFIDTFMSYGLTVIPLFVLMGEVANYSGTARNLYFAADKMLGRIPGKLAVATVVGATIFKAVCGSLAATTATFTNIAFPEMERYKYERKLSTGVIAVSGTLGTLMPPSVTLIIFGILTEQSIGRLFLAALIPAFMLSFFFIVIALVLCKVNPSLAPPSTRTVFREKLSSLAQIIWPALVMVVLILGLSKGVFTPTEAGAIGVFALLMLAVAKSRLSFKSFSSATLSSVTTGCMVLTLIAASGVFGHFVTMLDLPNRISEGISMLSLHRSIVVIIIFLVYLIGGSVVDDLAFLIMATPVFFPSMINLGYEPAWIGVCLAITIGLGGAIPPVAMCVFIVSRMTNVPMNIVYRGAAPFLMAHVLCIIFLLSFPGIASFLPNLLMGKLTG